METIHSHIHDLLILHDCVIIPELGGFVTNYQSAEITENNIFIPPRKAIAFNPQLSANDGLLANTISSIEGISYNTAMDEIAKFVATVKKGLKAEGFFMLPDIGKLKNSSNGLISFSPYKTNNFSAIGLSSFQVNPLIQEKLILPTKKSQNNRYKKWLVAGVSGAALIGIFINQSQPQKDTITFASMAPSISTSFLNNETVTEEDKDKSFVASNNILADIYSQEETNIETIESEKYHVVVGCFSHSTNAKRQQAIFDAMNYTTQTFTKGKLTGVSVGSFKSFVDAKELMDELRNSGMASSAWILVSD